MPRQFPVSQHQIHPKEEESDNQEHNCQRGEDAESHAGVEGSLVRYRDEEEED